MNTASFLIKQGLVMSFVKNRGITPIISVLLLTMIVVSAFVLVYIWGVSRLEFFRSTFSREIEFTKASLMEKLVVEDAWAEEVSPGVYNITLYVRNAGDIAVTIMGVYVNDTLVVGDLGLHLAPGSARFVTNIQVSAAHAEFFRVKLTTSRGNVVEAYAGVVG